MMSSLPSGKIGDISLIERYCFFKKITCVFWDKIPGVFFLILSLMFFFLCHAHVSTAGGNERMVISADMQYEYAEKLFHTKAYETAVIELKRSIYFFPDDDRVEASKFMLGKSLFYLKRFEEAISVFKALCYPYTGRKINVDSFFWESRTWLGAGNRGQAETVLRNLILLTEDETIKDRAYAKLAWIYIERAGNMDDEFLARALIYIEKISSSGKADYGAGEMKTLVNALMVQKRKNPIAAGLLSVIPGGGFLYCERFHDAAVAFLLNGAFFLAVGKSFESGNAALGGLTGVVGTGFYAGNIYGGISSAHKYNQSRRKGLIHKYYNALSYEKESVIKDKPDHLSFFYDDFSRGGEGKQFLLFTVNWRF